ncbi:amidase [Brevibacterium jeotgali]|uniref:Aspartyl-tRNA(Asn)/glutamyl-tRNA(Gln) amidotransferase subunit A n=1 Tax=Brevibacterium jeotgali TaxID=1262550 RepID=A0A2H1L6E3_9MICO|nr:amidase [Brevibacterium jeotgali]TWB99016.1 aspartyl-tRNA(Asn)/glutamyl-tRNA(Gln) amidotransferase subunit A [Brevibacterium jeotgali]SMY12477.1 aspartyl-tRNA(Asn)/glutamyl-tRNA(Gln) amidotransferase subunit A [Brevibacterium jeotgali]
MNPTAPHDTPADLSVAAMTERFRAGDLTPVEVLDAVRARVEACEPTLNALWWSDLDRQGRAQAAARASAERWQAGEALGPLDGVPVTVKENIAVEGVPMPGGHAAGDPPTATADAPITARLREGGAVLVGATVMPDWGMLSSGVSSRHGITRSPLDPSLTTGGSSSGAGAAAAAGYGPVHIGSDIGGSIRLPGTWLGLATLKPSFGRVPLDAPYLGRCAGPLARRTEDVLAAMQVIGRSDPRDFSALPAYTGDYTRPLSDGGADVRGLRIGVHTDAGCGEGTDPHVASVVRATADALSDAGAEVVEIAPFMDEGLLADVDRFWRVRSWADFSALDLEDQRRILPHVARWCMAGADVPAVELMRCYHSIQRMRATTVAATVDYDFVLSPVAPMAAFPAEQPMPYTDPSLPMQHIGFTVPYNMSEQPASSVHAGFTPDGRTVAVQVAGRRFDDAGVLALSERIEEIAAVPAPVRIVGA